MNWNHLRAAVVSAETEETLEETEAWLQRHSREGARVAIVDTLSGLRKVLPWKSAFIVARASRENEARFYEAGAHAVFQTLEHWPCPALSDEARKLPHALENIKEFRRLLGGRKPVVFLDYDGTLTPIVPTPNDAWLSQKTRERLERLSQRCVVSVVSGRALPDIQQRVGLSSVVYAANHGFDIEGPSIRLQMGQEFSPVLDAVEERLRHSLDGTQGILIERKPFSLAVHDRNVAEERKAQLEKTVEDIAVQFPTLLVTYGKCVRELQPRVLWNKGQAVEWLWKKWKLSLFDALPIYIGDDLTDETVFEVLAGKGLCILVRDENRTTGAQWALDSVWEVGLLLDELEGLL